ncbi:MAG TPA: GNAT family N-acetyltransferase [Actinomycetes bacterium]|nr:GNAT family N-acetyltransferase [Actinomycetes bacterium]
MRTTTSWGGRTSADETVAVLRRWERPGDCAWQLHAGDVGWHLRLDDDAVDHTLLQVRDDGDLVGVGLLDGPAVVRLALDPRLLHDADLARVVAEAVEDRLGRPGAAEAYVDGPGASRWRAELARRGWDLDPDPWVHLWRPLGPADAARDVPGVAAVSGPADVTDRVAVQRAAFANSTFTESRWAQMAGSTAYDPSFDLLARDDDGAAVAALMAWTAGEGRCALVEPMGTAAGHQREGHGRRLLEGAAAALARAGASGVAVWTAASNEVAVAAYRSAGFSAIGLAAAMCSTA